MKSEAQSTQTPSHRTQPSRETFQDLDAGDQVAAPLNVNMMTRDSILQLQRLIGNQAVQRLMGVKPPQIQRADAPVEEKTSQGLMEEEASSRFAQTIFEWTQNPANAEKPMSEFTTVLEEALNAELDAAGVPRVYVYFETLDGARACFVSGEWIVKVDCDAVFGGILQTVGDLGDEQLKGAVGTLYHEGRHAEQFFLIARVRAAEMTDAGQSSDQIAQALASDLGIKAAIAEQAAANPLRDADATTLNLIESFEQSLYGEDKAYQDIVYGMYDAAVKPVYDTAVAVQSLVPGDYDGLPPEEQQKIKPQVEFLAPILEMHIRVLQQYRDQQLQPELDRVLAKPITLPPGNNGTMLDHLGDLIGQVNSILAYQPFPREPMQALESALTIQMTSKSSKHELLMADWALPEQVDAEKAGQQAGKAFGELGQPEP